MIMLMLACISSSYAQDAEKKEIGDEVYAVYKEKGIDKAIETYHTLKKKKALEYTFDEHQLNNIGYKIMNNDSDAQAAKKVFWLNMVEYPDAINPQDSYGDVLVRLGEKEEARKYYEGAVQAYKKQGSFERNVSRGASAKMAVLDKKHQALNFLAGNWATNTTYWNEQNKEYKDTGEVSFNYFNDIVLVGEMKPKSRENQEIRGHVWVITYNAQEDVYETAWVDADLKGLMASKMKIQNKEGNKHIFLEEFMEDEDAFNIRHEIVPQGNTIQWVMYESKNGQEFRKMFQVDMSKPNITKK
jgi:tetratricopeptide (TPR) repeat protein